jgi:hypothetical protein
MPRAAAILANTLFLFAWAAWLGGIVTLGAVSAPGIFRTAREWPETGSAELVRRFAGAAAGEGFRRFNGLALAAGMLLLVSAVAAWALDGGRAGRRVGLHAIRLALVTAAFGIALWLTLHLFPTLVAVRQAGTAGEFDALHHAYERWTMAEFWLLVAAGLLTAVLGTDARPASRLRSAFDPGTGPDGAPAPKRRRLRWASRGTMGGRERQCAAGRPNL